MIGPLYVVLVLGCADGPADCKPIDRTLGPWRGADACEAAIADVLAEHTNADYPTIAGRCVRQAPALLAQTR